MRPVSYSSRELARLLHLAPRQLRRWQRLGLFPRRERYGWHELARARLLCRFQAAAISPRHLRQGLNAVRARLPELGDPFSQAGLGVVGRRLEVRYGGASMDALSGQLRLPFDDGAPAPTPRARPGKDQAHDDAELWFTFGLSLESEPEMRSKAIAAYERCLELDPGFGSAYINLGTLRYHAKQLAAAEQCYRAALRLDPDYALAHFNLGNVLDETGRLEEAVAAYLEAVRLAPQYPDAHYNLALAYQRQGQLRRALPHWRTYLGLDASSPWADHARVQLKQTLERDLLQLVKRATASPQ